MDRIENLRFIIGRFDHYYDTINNKGNAMLALNTFSIGGVATFYTALQGDVNWSVLLKICGIIMCSMWTFSLFCTSWALMPFQSSNSESLIYYGSIAKHTEKTFLKKIHDRDEKDTEEDMERQTYHLAKGLTAKFDRLKWATYSLLGSYIVLIFTIIILLNSLK